MEEVVRILLKNIEGQGLVALLLVIAIMYLQKRLDKLESKIMECEEDRKNLWERLLNTNHEHH